MKAQTESQVCIFCHVPHRGLQGGTNRKESNTVYTPYKSSTMVSPAPGMPTGSSRMCLSCHDGTLAVGQTAVSGKIAMSPIAVGRSSGYSSYNQSGRISDRNNLGTDLRKSHPISFVPSNVAEHRIPVKGDPVKLDGSGQLQCTSCHEPHQMSADPVQGDFLVKSNMRSGLCTTCHAKLYWDSNPSSHAVSTKRFDERLGAITKYSTVQDNGCESCHRPHGAVAQGGRLLRDTVSDTCLVCHRGQVADKNIDAEIRKLYAHPIVGADPALHDEAEGPTGQRKLPEVSGAAPRHVQCVDCHNPHGSYKLDARAPAVSGSLSGTWGIDRSGAAATPAQYEYEVCFKCHGDSANQPQQLVVAIDSPRRAVADVNLRRKLDASSAASFHPVETTGRNADVPSLIAPLSPASIIYCGDCHGSDSTAVKGPHGSNIRHILVAKFDTTDGTSESPSSYALCYKCHDRASILKGTTFSGHGTHVVQQRTSCATCHDSHGVSSVQGSVVNNAHLINFDTSVVRPNAKGVLKYTSNGVRNGSCSLSCHGVQHDETAYAAGAPVGAKRGRQMKFQYQPFVPSF
jgi:predicted CXXCH cytochrome family protein